MTKRRKQKPAVEPSGGAPRQAAPAPKAPVVWVPPPEQPLPRFFVVEDWIAAGVTFLISVLIYFHTMSPTITLQDSGELVTGAYNFGVPHPPGYPLWSFLGWVWRHIVLFGNPAWRICLMSVLTGGCVVASLTMLMKRSLLILLDASPWSDALDDGLKRWMALTIGVFSGMMFAFNRGVWLWACVPEMRVLSVFMFILTSFTFFKWTLRPERHTYLYWTIGLLGLGISNHQTLLVMVVPIVVGVFATGLQPVLESRPMPWRPSVVMPNLREFWALVVAGLVCTGIISMIKSWLDTSPDATFYSSSSVWLTVGAPFVGLWIWLIFGKWGWLKRRIAVFSTLFFLLGSAFYLYMPIAASTNPPMNWGYSSTREGFLHHITRGQYQQLNIASPFKSDFWMQVWLFVRALVNQYTLPLCLVALFAVVVYFGFWRRLRPRGRSWLSFVGAAFLTTSFGLLSIINPGVDRQNWELNIKFFAPAHGFYAMFIGYGVALAMAAVAARWKGTLRFLRVACLALLVLPAIPYARSWPICEKRNHDFGYQFGYRMFYPGGGYPPMEKNAVLYGGTDPGRFVPTYMILTESFAKPKDRYVSPFFDSQNCTNFDRRDVYIITQNALADNTYMNYIRDHYDFTRPNANKPETLEKFLPWQRAVFRWGWKHLGRDERYPPDPIFIPSQQDCNGAFQKYVEGVQSGKIPAGADVKVENGRVSVQGVQGVMTINGILAQWIFDKNKDKHAFYVEESYVIPWMYPFLTPYGVIMKLNRDPVPGPQEDRQQWMDIIMRDRTYWDKVISEFEARPEFQRDTDAQKSFSKMRTAIAGLYEFRRIFSEADYAYKQAIRLYPESPEASFRLANLYMQVARFDDAINVMKALQNLDPLNAEIQKAIEQFNTTKEHYAKSQPKP